jgi:hypothetical protein
MVQIHLRLPNSLQIALSVQLDIFIIKRSLRRTMIVRLLDIYDELELDDEEEALYHFVCEDHEEVFYEVTEMEPDFFERLVSSSDGHSSILQLYRDHANKDQKSIVADKVDNFDEDRIVVLNRHIVVDGNHHIIAAAQLGRSIKVIDLENPVPKNTMNKAF